METILTLIDHLPFNHLSQIAIMDNRKGTEFSLYDATKDSIADFWDILRIKQDQLEVLGNGWGKHTMIDFEPSKVTSITVIVRFSNGKSEKTFEVVPQFVAAYGSNPVTETSKEDQLSLLRHYSYKAGYWSSTTDYQKDFQILRRKLQKKIYHLAAIVAPFYFRLSNGAEKLAHCHNVASLVAYRNCLSYLDAVNLDNEAEALNLYETLLKQ